MCSLVDDNDGGRRKRDKYEAGRKAWIEMDNVKAIPLESPPVLSQESIAEELPEKIRITIELEWYKARSCLKIGPWMRPLSTKRFSGWRKLGPRFRGNLCVQKKEEEIIKSTANEHNIHEIDVTISIKSGKGHDLYIDDG